MSEFLVDSRRETTSFLEKYANTSRRTAVSLEFGVPLSHCYTAAVIVSQGQHWLSWLTTRAYCRPKRFHTSPGCSSHRVSTDAGVSTSTRFVSGRLLSMSYAVTLPAVLLVGVLVAVVPLIVYIVNSSFEMTLFAFGAVSSPVSAARS